MNPFYRPIISIMKDGDDFIIKCHLWDSSKERPPYFYDFIISKGKVIYQSDTYSLEFKNTTDKRKESLLDGKYQLFDHLSGIGESDLQLVLKTFDEILSKNHKEISDHLNNK